jgi:hypothetical protein
MSDKSGTSREATTKQEEAALRQIEALEDPGALRTLLANARAKNSPLVERAAFQRLARLVPHEQPETLEYDFWMTTQAYELLLTEKNGRTTRANRLRQKVERVGELQTLENLALAREASDGFKLLMARGMPELTAEAIILKHRDKFSPAAVEASRARLEEAGYDASRFGSTA